jgi:hypothetical protein
VVFYGFFQFISIAIVIHCEKYRNVISIDMTETPQRKIRWYHAGCLISLFPCTVVGLFFLLIGPLSPPPFPEVSPAPFPANFMKGVTYESWWNGEFASARSDTTLKEKVLPLGANWIAVIVKCHQATLTATDIQCQTDKATATDDELRHVMSYAHELGFNVMLKPHLDLLDLENSSGGRHQISFGGDETKWGKWFESYTRFILHYARLAQELEVEAFTIGTELMGTTHRADDWRRIIRQIRRVYEGDLTYAALSYFEPLQITWWDELDYIGIDAYFTVTLTKNPTLAQMRLGWLPTSLYLDWLANRWKMPIIFTEIGYMSVDGATILPGDWSSPAPVDLEEQANAYRAVFETFQGKHWWRGVFWWSLDTKPDQGGRDDRSFTFLGKPAEQVIRRYYAS